MSFLTIYVLFEEDVRILGIPISLDEVFMTFNCIALALFLIDLVMSSIVFKGYFFGFYFWLDIIATVSLLTDITWIWYEIVGLNVDVSKHIDVYGNIDPRKIRNSSAASQGAMKAMLIIRQIRLF
jgi:hypothetical protein